MSNKLHWYLLVYVGDSFEGHRHSTGSTYVGFEQQRVTLPQINLHMQSAKIAKGVLVNCSYLGYMTQYEFENNVPSSGGGGEGVPVLSVVSAA